MILLRRRYAALCITSQNRFWGFRFGERSTRMTEMMVVLTGLGFIAIGLAALMSVLGLGQL